MVSLQAAGNAEEVSELRKLFDGSREQLETAQFRATEADTRVSEVQTEVQGLRSRAESAERKEQVRQQCTTARVPKGQCWKLLALVHGLRTPGAAQGAPSQERGDQRCTIGRGRRCFTRQSGKAGPRAGAAGEGRRHRALRERDAAIHNRPAAGP